MTDAPDSPAADPVSSRAPDPAPAPAPPGRGPGDVLVPVGVALFGVGVLAVVVVVALFLVTGGEVPLALSLGSALGPVGLGLALVGLLRQGRAASREARRERAERRAHARR